MYLYMVIRGNGYIGEGLTARNPDATYGETFHVLHGRGIPTRFITTTTDLQVARAAMRNTDRIVRIDLLAARNAGVQVLDIQRGNNVRGDRARLYAQTTRAVLLYGALIPSSALTILEGIVRNIELGGANNILRLVENPGRWEPWDGGRPFLKIYIYTLHVYYLLKFYSLVYVITLLPLK